MKRTMRKLFICCMALVPVVIVLSSNDGAVRKGEISWTSAQAVRGRPATPLSYAGVARRTTRRAYVAGAASGPRCRQIVDALGRVITRCY